jgi:dolichyl-diphosphooligosaccharide--protein glycosyltransferase
MDGNRFDELSWYPLGRVVGGTVYPGIMVTAGIIHWFLNKLHFTIHIREVCVFLAPLFSALTAVATYALTSEFSTPSAGLLAALFIGVVPGYISRSVAGSYDNEAIAIFLLVFTFYLWIKSLKLGSAFYATLAALSYFWMVSAWGGYVFIINMIPLHAFVLLLMGRFSTRLYVAYSTFYVIGTLSSMQIPFVGFQPTRTSEHMAALGTFGLMQIVAFAELLRSLVSKDQFKLLLRVSIFGLVAVGLSGLFFLVSKGYIAPFTGRYYSLWDTGYAKIHIPIIASVSEHQPTAWPSFFFDLGLLMPLLPAGMYICYKHLKDEHLFIVIYATLASYFAGVMVRLMLTLTPIVCVASAMALSSLFDVFLAKAPLPDEIPAPKEKEAKKDGKKKSPTQGSAPVLASTPGIWSADLKIMTIVPFFFLLCQFVSHSTWVTSHAYSSPSIVLASQNRDGSQHIIDDFREAYYWLRQNTHEKAKIMSWWDYGYQITGMSNRTVLVDNNTWNNTHIATVGKAMSTPEEVAYPVMRKHDVDYVLVIFGGLIGYSGDDINKFLWMIRIGQGVYPKDVSERKFFTDSGEYKVGAEATSTMKNSLMYKMSYYRFTDYAGPYQPMRDHVRGEEIPKTPIKLWTVDEGGFWKSRFFLKKN